jgi:hypothetical protein
MERSIINFLKAQFTAEQLIAAAFALLVPRQKRGGTRTIRKGRRASRKPSPKETASE